MTKIIRAFKGFDKDLKCRDFQYEIGEEYVQKGKIKLCERGFHACTRPVDIFNYYLPSQNTRFALVECSGEVDENGNGDSKIASSRIKIVKEVDLVTIVLETIEFNRQNSKPEIGSSATGTQGAASATGEQGAASATGEQGAASATGNQGAASATGWRGAASATGWRGAASATGDYGAASATGKWGFAAATGIKGKVKAALGGFITAIEWVVKDGIYQPIGIKSAIVDGEIIKADTYYILKNGNFTETI